jgi:hypothetical protein
MGKHYVVLEVENDDDETSNLHKWRWNKILERALLKVTERHSVRVARVYYANGSTVEPTHNKPVKGLLRK